MSTDFIYLSEQDMIKAGVLDQKRCISVCEDVFELLSKGDYLMGGANHNSHGMSLVFPKESKFPNMPIAGPDRRFCSMIAYLGGRFDICGNKWYGSNAQNKNRDLPRSVLTLLLNDKSTGEPLAFMSANLLSAARTGAIPGIGAKYLARKDSKVITLIGCGPINESCFDAIITQCPNITQVILKNRSPQKAVELAKKISEKYGLQTQVCEDLEEAVRSADVISIAASRTQPLFIKDEWVKPGTVMLVSGPVQCEDSLWKSLKIVLDHRGLHHSYVDEAISSGDKQAYYSGVIGGPVYTLMDKGELPQIDDMTDMGDIVTGKKSGRMNEDERIMFIACGMAVFDVAWGHDLWQTAIQNEIGTKLRLWDTPYQVGK